MKIPKWQHELARYYKWGKLVSYLLNSAAKTCLYGLKISENIEIGHFFQSRTFFYLSSNLHTSCLSAFKCYVIKQCLKKFFIVRNTIILQAAILDCSEAAVHSLPIFENLSRKYRWYSLSFGQISDWLFRVAIIC